jgi:hypothetical protein
LTAAVARRQLEEEEEEEEEEGEEGEVRLRNKEQRLA